MDFHNAIADADEIPHYLYEVIDEDGLGKESTCTR